MRILLIEDDPCLGASLVEALRREGYTVDLLAQAEQVCMALRDVHYDAVLLDIGLPGMDGLSLLGQLRARACALPIMLITARDDWEDKVRGLDLGADDYLAKPFMLPELLARLRALLRRASANKLACVQLGALALDMGEHSASLSGEPLPLTRKEWALLLELVMQSPQLVPKRKLIDSLGHWDRELSANALELHVSRLRLKLAVSGLKLETVRGLGYRLLEQASTRAEVTRDHPCDRP